MSLYQLLLEEVGFEIIGSARNGKEAVQKYKSFSEKPDVILMDHRMPLMSGLQAMKEILKESGPLRVIFVSADVSVKDRALKAGAVAFLEKPFKVNDLLTVLQEGVKREAQMNNI